MDNLIFTGKTDNIVMLVKGNTVIHRINTRMLHDAEGFKEALPWPYKGEYERDMFESMWMGNTIKEKNIKTPDDDVN